MWVASKGLSACVRRGIKARGACRLKLAPQRDFMMFRITAGFKVMSEMIHNTREHEEDMRKDWENRPVRNLVKEYKDTSVGFNHDRWVVPNLSGGAAALDLMANPWDDYEEVAQEESVPEDGPAYRERTPPPIEGGRNMQAEREEKRRTRQLEMHKRAMDYRKKRREEEARKAGLPVEDLDDEVLAFIDQQARDKIAKEMKDLMDGRAYMDRAMQFHSERPAVTIEHVKKLEDDEEEAWALGQPSPHQEKNWVAQQMAVQRAQEHIVDLASAPVSGGVYRNEYREKKEREKTENRLPFDFIWGWLFGRTDPNDGMTDKANEVPRLKEWDYFFLSDKPEHREYPYRHARHRVWNVKVD